MTSVNLNGQVRNSSNVSSENHEEVIAKWEDELDQLGAFATLSQLEAHLSACPVGAPSKTYLEGYIAGRKLTM